VAVGSFTIGDVILGKYEVTRVLGEGGMGVVVAARHVELDELVALKFLLPSLQAQPELCARFAREAKTGIRIKNEHVARVLDVGTLPDGTAFMVMEHLLGEDLATVLERRGALPVEETVDLLLQACEAIAEAHELGIVHRDLKPANLFVTTGSDGLPFVKVLDFGISKTIVDVENVSVTATSAVLGSPLYMSPEQLASSRDVDRRADVWSLGVILYEMLAGKPPFSGTSYPTLCAAILGGKYERLAQLASRLPAELDLAVASALVLDREARTPSVAAFAGHVSPFASDAGKASSARIRRIAEHSVSASRSMTPMARPSGFDATLPLSEPALAVDGAGGRAAQGGPAPTGAGFTRSDAVLGAPAARGKASRSVARGVVGVALVGAIGFASWNHFARPPEPAGAPSAGPVEAANAPSTSSAAPLPTAPTEEPAPAAEVDVATRAVTDAASATATVASTEPSPAARPAGGDRKNPRSSSTAAGAAAHKPSSTAAAPSADLFGSQK
jgi:hypothetical protein